MANLLNWSGSIGLRKKDENNLQAPLITSLRTLNPTPTRVNTNNTVNVNNNNANNTANNVASNAFVRAQQVNDQIRQQAEQRRQQEEQERQRQIERMRQEQEQRRQQEEARRAQEQQARQQKQQSLLNSSLNGGSLIKNLSNSDSQKVLSAGLTTDFNKAQIAKNSLNQDILRRKTEGQAREIANAQAEAEKQRQLNEAETNRLTNMYEKRLQRNTDILNRAKSGEKLSGSLNAFGDYTELGKTNNFGQESPVQVKNQLPVTERQLENRVKNDQEILEAVKKGAKPITLAEGLKFVGNEISQAAGNAILGEQTEGENGFKQVLRALLNVPGSMAGGLMTIPASVGDAVNPYETRNTLEKNGDGTVSANTKENTAATRLGAAADAALMGADIFTGGEGAILRSLAKSGAKSTAKQVGKQAVKTGLVEGTQEASQNLAQELAEEGKWDEGTLARTAQAAGVGATVGGLLSGASSGISAVKDYLQNRKNNNATNVSQNTEANAQNDTNVANTIQTTNDGQWVKQNADGTATRLSDAELADAIDQSTNAQQNTANGLNSFQNNAPNLRSSAEDINTLARRASQGDTYAQQRLAELTKQDQEEGADWRGKSVNEVINPANQDIGLDDDVAQNVPNNLDNRTFNELTPVEQEEWLTNNSDQVPSETQLAQALRQINIDPTGMSRLNMLREYSKAVDNTSPEVKTASEISNMPEVLQSERDAAERQTPAPVSISLENLAQEPAVPTITDTVGTGEGTTDASTRIPTTRELSTATPEEALVGYRESLTQNNNEAVSRDVLKNLTDALDIDVKNGTQKISGTNMEKMSGRNLNPRVVNIDEIFSGVTDKNARSFRKRAFDLATSLFNNKQVTVEDTGTSTQINKKGLRKTFSDNIPPSKVQSANKIGQIVEQGIYGYTTTNPNSTDGILYHHFFTPVNYDGENGIVRTVIKEYTNEPSVINKYYYHQMELLDDTKNGGTPSITPSRRTNVALEGSASNNSILSQNSENVNANSSFAENTSANRNFSEETRKALKNNPISYKPTTNEERLARANEILSTKTPDEIDTYLRDNFFNVKAKNASSEDMVLAGEFAKMLDAKGQYDRSTEIINKMSEIGTKQGQNIQAMSLMMNRSPEGIANMAQNAIKKGGGEMNGEVRRQIVEKTQEIGRTRGERAQLSERNDVISQQIMNGEGDLRALRKEQMQIAQKYRLNLDQEGRQFAQLTDVVNKNSPDNRSIFGSVWRAGLLSGPRTHTGNMVSNTFQNVLNAGSDRIASGLDWARAKITGNEREVVASAGGRGKGLKRGLSAAKEVLKTGDNLWEGTDIVTGKTTAWGQGGELEFKNKVANNMVAKPTNYVFRAMSAGDLPFRYAAFENAIRTEAKRQGVNQGYKGQALQDYINSRVATPDPELQAYGISKGNESVYDVDTKLSDVMNRVDKFIDGQDNKIVKNGLKAVKTLVAPFVKVPSKVLSTAIDYSPLGSVKAIVNKVGSKGYTTAQFETDLAKSGLGTAGFVGLGYALSAAGLLTGGYPDSADERNRWKAEGIEPNSIKIGDTYLSLNYLGPASMLMAMGSGVQQRQANGEDALSIAQGTVMDTLNTFLDQSYVQGLSNALNAITDSNRYGESYVNSFARGLVPNLLRQTATATDPMQRQANNAGEAVVSGIPGASQNLDAKVDTYGREIENKQALPLGQMWDALKLSKSRETNNVIDEVSRLHNVDPSNKDLQVTPPKEDNTLSVDGQNIKITDAQKTQLQKDVGNAAVKAMRQVMQSEKYSSLSDLEKAKALDKARSDAQADVRKQFAKTNNITANSNPETKKSGGSAEGNFASKAIANATTSNSGGRKSSIEINEKISGEYKDILSKYNSMSSEDWNKYLYGSSAESASAEYKLAKAKYENDLANGKLSDVQKVKRQKELRKLEVSKDWEKTYRDAYGLAGTKSDMQNYLNTLDDDTRSKTVSVLNGLNKAMYEAGIIKASTYKTRYNAINNTTTAKSGSKGRKKGSGGKSSNGITSAEASALSDLAKTMVKNTNKGTTKAAKTPETKRKMTKTKSSGNKTNLATYTPSNKKVTVSKGTKKSIA